MEMEKEKKVDTKKIVDERTYTTSVKVLADKRQERKKKRKEGKRKKRLQKLEQRKKEVEEENLKEIKKLTGDKK
jgi:hypothetical protein